MDLDDTWTLGWPSKLAPAEEAVDAESDPFDAAESALDAAPRWEPRRQERYAARYAHERAGTAVDRLQRRVREASERLDRMQE